MFISLSLKDRVRAFIKIGNEALDDYECWSTTLRTSQSFFCRKLVLFILALKRQTWLINSTSWWPYEYSLPILGPTSSSGIRIVIGKTTKHRNKPMVIQISTQTASRIARRVNRIVGRTGNRTGSRMVKLPISVMIYKHEYIYINKYIYKYIN